MRNLFIAIPLLILACGEAPTDQDGNVDPVDTTQAEPINGSAVESYEQMMDRIDQYIIQLEDSGGYTCTSKRIGSLPKFIDIIAYFVEGEIVKLETYVFEGTNKKLSERMYFNDKRIVRFDNYERHVERSADRIAREERHYFDQFEKLVRSAYREDVATSGDFPDLSVREFSPLVDQDIEMKGKLITGKMMNYTNEMATADEVGYNSLTVNWPEGNWDIETLKQEFQNSGSQE